MPQPRPALGNALLVAGTLACAAAFAQPAQPSPAAASAAERAQKESDRTKYWIRVLATKPAPDKPVAAPKPAAAAASAASAAAKSTTEARAKVKPTLVQAPACTAVPVPVSEARASNPAQAPVGAEPEQSAPGTRGVIALTNPEAATNPDAASNLAPEADPGLIQVRSVPPEFPASIVERIRNGHVEIQFEVGTDGSVVDAEVVESSNPHLNNAAVYAVKQWRFMPTSMLHTALVNLVFDIDRPN